MSFADALAQVLAREGGWYPGDQPSDSNPTMKGIIQRTYDAYRERKHLLRQSVRAITDAEIEEIYRTEYWNKVRGDELPLRTAIAVFDMAVNSGPGPAIETLQYAVGATPDGVLGPVTLAKVKAADDRRLSEDFLWERVDFYGQLCRKKPIKLSQLPGWLRRLELLRRAIQ